MWIFLNDAFFSIVQPTDWKSHEPSPNLIVRSRFPDDIKRVFPDAKVSKTPNRDYLFRAVVNRELIAKKMAIEVSRIAYSNFKSSVQEDERHDAYSDVWTVMFRAQKGAYKRQQRGGGYAQFDNTWPNH